MKYIEDDDDVDGDGCGDDDDDDDEADDDDGDVDGKVWALAPGCSGCGWGARGYSS